MEDALLAAGQGMAQPCRSLLNQALKSALGPAVGIAITDVRGDPTSLWPSEAEAVRAAVPRRRAEFAAGRAAARQALQALGQPAQALPMAPDRSPVWPAGFVGSIAHNAHVCVVLVGERKRVHALGVDVEADGPLGAELWPIVCRPEEQAWLRERAPQDQGRWALRFFCAKEAFYKWQYPQSQRMLDFQDVSIVFAADGLTFDVRWAGSSDDGKQLPLVTGRSIAADGFWLSWLIGPGNATLAPSVREPMATHAAAKGDSRVTHGATNP